MTPRRAALAPLLLSCCLAPAVAGGPQARDPWSPGASLEPWPLIERLQRWGLASEPEPDWRVAAAHRDPLVRAAAAAALGRTFSPERRPFVEPLLGDRVRLVRQAAQWAVLQSDEPIPVSVVDDALRDLRAEDHDARHSTPGLVAVLERWVPSAVIRTSPAERRQWLRERAGGRLQPPTRLAAVPDSGVSGTIRRVADRSRCGWVAAERSQWDGDEVVELTWRAMAAPFGGPASERVLLASDPHRRFQDRGRKPSAYDAAGPSVTLRLVGGDGTGRFDVAEGALARVAFDLGDVPPDVYTFRYGNPLFLRVRRGAAMEARGSAAAASVLDSEETRERVARLRMMAAAPMLRAHFADSVKAHGVGFNAYRDALVLARLPDRVAAEQVLPALFASPALVDPWTSGRPDLAALFRTGFGGAGRDVLTPLFADWRRALSLGWHEALADILADRDLTGVPALDTARGEIVSGTAHGGLCTWDDGRPGRDYKEEKLLYAALTAMAAEHPREVGACLARVTRGGQMGLLKTITAGLTTTQIERLVEATGKALAGSAPGSAELRAALSQEATALGIRLPDDAPPVP